MSPEIECSHAEQMKLALAHLCRSVGTLNQELATHVGGNQGVAELTLPRDYILLKAMLEYLACQDGIFEEDAWCIEVFKSYQRDREGAAL